MGTSNATIQQIQQQSSSSIPSVVTEDLTSSDLFSREKPRKNVCPYCNISCTKPSVLDKHIRTHTNERPFPCTPCKIAFKTQSNLYKHCRSRTHSLKVESNIDSSSAEILDELGDSFREELVTERVQHQNPHVNPVHLPQPQSQPGKNLAVFHPGSHHQSDTRQNQRIPPIVEQTRRENLSVPLVQIEKPEQIHQGSCLLISYISISICNSLGIKVQKFLGFF